jgi:ligand-binding sensor domain-containing protein
MIPGLRTAFRAGWLFAGALMVLGMDGLAQDWEVFNASGTGMLTDRVQAIAHDSAGNTWLGTDWGLYRFDGTTWETYLQGASGLPENDVRALACDHQGRVWVGMFTEGLAVFDGESWQHFPGGTENLPGSQFKNITIDRWGYAWLATSGGVVRTDLEEWRVYTDTDESFNGQMLPGTNISDVAVREDGLVLVGTMNAGLVYLTDTSITVYNSFNIGLPDNTALGVAIGQGGDRWLACPYGGAIRNFGDFQGGLWHHYLSDNSGLPSNALNDVVIDAADRKIFALQAAGVAILSGFNDWQVFNTGNSSLPSNEVLCLSLGNDGTLWAGTADGGAARFDLFVGTADVTGIGAPRVFPNPTNGPLQVDPGGWLPGRWGIVDLTGREVISGIWRDGRIDLSGLPPAPYLLHLTGSHGSASVRVLVK